MQKEYYTISELWEMYQKVIGNDDAIRVLASGGVWRYPVLDEFAATTTLCSEPVRPQGANFIEFRQREEGYTNGRCHGGITATVQGVETRIGSYS